MLPHRDSASRSRSPGHCTLSTVHCVLLRLAVTPSLPTEPEGGKVPDLGVAAVIPVSVTKSCGEKEAATGPSIMKHCRGDEVTFVAIIEGDHGVSVGEPTRDQSPLQSIKALYDIIPILQLGYLSLKVVHGDVIGICSVVPQPMVHERDKFATIHGDLRFRGCSLDSDIPVV